MVTVSPAPAHALTSTTTGVSCLPLSLKVGQQTYCTVTVSSTGNPPGTVTMMTTPHGTFNPTSCTLGSPNGTAESCTVTYTPTTASPSTQSVGASYGGDPTYASSDSSTSGLNATVTVSPVQSSLIVNCPTATVPNAVICTATVSGYRPSGTVNFQNQGGTAAIKLPQPPYCVFVTPGQSSSTCQITITATGAGTATILGTYSGDNNNIAPSTYSATLTESQTTPTLQVSCVGPPFYAGQLTTCTASLMGSYNATGSITWASTDPKATFSAYTCQPSPSGSCGVQYTPTITAQVTASFAGDVNNRAVSAKITVTVNVVETIQLTVANTGPSAQITLSGCSVSPTSILADGTPYTFTASSGCSGIVASLPPAGASTRYLTAGGQNSITIGSCSSSSCQTFSATIYYQLLNTYEASPASPSSWSAPGTIHVSGTALGMSGQPVCTISVVTGGGQFSCQGWSDYNTQTTVGPLQTSQNLRWASAQSAFTDTSAGNIHTCSYYSQVLETFDYSLAGSTTAPSTPRLSYTTFGAATSTPLTGSESSIWLDTGSGWSVPSSLSGSTGTERWQTSIASGAATAGQSVPITYYHQFMVTFGFSVKGGGVDYLPPTASFSSFGATSKGTSGWADAGSTYNYTNPLAGSTSLERWMANSTGAQGKVTAASTVSPSFYHQFAFSMNFTVIGGGPYNNARLNFTSLGVPSLEQLSRSTSTFWLDASTNWAVSSLLPSSTPSEQWITTKANSGTALAPVTATYTYYHQFLGTLQYSILGPGGSPPVPSVNYTSVGFQRTASLTKTPTGYWMDSGSTWSSPTILPGTYDERWQSNMTLPGSATEPFVLDLRFTHQFFVAVGVNNPAAGSVANTDQWRNQGDSVILNATAAKQWSFAYWRGQTPFSYNGTVPLPAFVVLGPANETAVFYPGLTITTGNQGSVDYSFGTINGTVPVGGNSTIYPPPGRNVTLIVRPINVDIKFLGWTGLIHGAELESSVAITSPGHVQAAFSLDYGDIQVFFIASLVVFVSACYVFIVNRGYTPRMRQPKTPAA